MLAACIDTAEAGSEACTGHAPADGTTGAGVGAAGYRVSRKASTSASAPLELVSAACSFVTRGCWPSKASLISAPSSVAVRFHIPASGGGPPLRGGGGDGAHGPTAARSSGGAGERGGWGGGARRCGNGECQVGGGGGGAAWSGAYRVVYCLSVVPVRASPGSSLVRLVWPGPLYRGGGRESTAGGDAPPNPTPRALRDSGSTRQYPESSRSRNGRYLAAQAQARSCAHTHGQMPRDLAGMQPHRPLAEAC